MSCINRALLTFKSLKWSSFISLVRICHRGVVEKQAREIVLPLKAGYLLLATRSAGCLIADRAIVNVSTNVKEGTWLGLSINRKHGIAKD